MATLNNWNLMYVAGNPKMFRKVRSDANNPLKRSVALASAKKMAENNWRVWVEHKDSGERIYESDIEKQYATIPLKLKEFLNGR
ncbi:hypothetical protein A3715_15580 [Oleiphilus sp. HI0009]|nr:hypothetical protein A3715_15580 [Oleiphilus sp. HI0009]